MATSAAGANTVKLADLSAPQLTQLKKQLDEEIAHLTNSHTQLRAAQAKFKDCILSLQKGLDNKNESRSILVPLTSSLYVPGTLADLDKVIVDVGTGYFAEKSRADAKNFYEAKVRELGENLGKLEAVVRQKSESLGIIEDGLRQKILAQQGQAGQTAAAS